MEAKHDLTTTSYPLWTVDNDLIRQLVDRAGGKQGGIVSPKGPAGSMILFHSCLVHASGSNLSPFNRVAVYLSLCAVSNHIRRHKRPEYIAHRDFTPIECLPDDCLLKPYPVDLPWERGMPASALETSTDELKMDLISVDESALAVTVVGDGHNFATGSDLIVVERIGLPWRPEFGVGAIAEFFADKIAWVDSAWDAVHGFVRPVGGAAPAHCRRTPRS